MFHFASDLKCSNFCLEPTSGQTITGVKAKDVGLFFRAHRFIGPSTTRS